MDSQIVAAVIAVLGTLGGAAVTAWVQSGRPKRSRHWRDGWNATKQKFVLARLKKMWLLNGWRSWMWPTPLVLPKRCCENEQSKDEAYAQALDRLRCGSPEKQPRDFGYCPRASYPARWS